MLPSTGEERQYEEVSLTIKVRKDGWRRKVLDRGKAGFIGKDVTKMKPPPPIRDENGDPVQEPVLLDGKGSKLAADTKPVFLAFKTKADGAFGNLLRLLGT